MRTRDRIATLTALGLIAGLAPAFAFEGTVRPPGDVPAAAAIAAPTPVPAISRMRPDVPRPPGAIPNTGGVMPVVVPNAPLPRPTGPLPALAAPTAPADRPLPAPAFAAPATPITPFEALKSGTRALKDGDTGRARVSLEYAAEQGLIGAQWKLGRMYADGEGVDQSDLQAFKYFSRIADEHADDNPASPQARYIASAFVALGHYYRDGIPNTDVTINPVRARQMYAYAASYFRDADGQYHLGRMMLDNGPFRDTRQAAMWLNAAANKGQHQAQAVLGRMLFKGEPGIPRQAARGLMWLTLALANAAPGETWIAELHDSAFKQATDEERAQAGDDLMRWRNATSRRETQPPQ